MKAFLAIFLILCSGLVMAETPAPTAPVVDHHQHLFSPALAEMLTGKSQGLSAGVLGSLLDEAGIRRAVVLSAAYMYGSPARKVEDEYAKVRAENDWIAKEALRFPERLTAIMSVNPLREYAVKEIERCAAEPRKWKGLKLHFGNSDVQLEDASHLERLQRVFRAANENRLAIIVHMRPSISLKRPYGPEQARIFLEKLLPLAKDVTVQVAHLAASGPGYDDAPAVAAMSILAEAVRRRDRHTTNLWFDVTTVAAPQVSPEVATLLVQLIREVGPERVVYGSDAAYGDNLRPREGWAAFRKLPLLDREHSLIAGNIAPYLK